MPLTIDDLPELLRLLREHPEWRDALRATLLTEELLQLPALTERRFAELASAIERLTERQERTEAALAELAARQAETESHLTALASRLRELAQRMDRIEAQIAALAERAVVLTDDSLWFKEIRLEAICREKAPALFSSPQLRRVRALPLTHLDDLLEPALDEGRITWDERKAIMQADLVVRGHTPEAEQLYLVVEVSWGVSTTDIARAIERAEMLRKAGFPARPAVAGRWLSPDAQRMLDALSGDDRPVIALDGTIAWDGRS